MVRDRLAERFALFGVLDRVLKGGGGDAHSAGGYVHATDLYRRHYLQPALALLAAQQAGRRHARVLERQLCRVDSLIPQLLKDAPHGHARCRLLLDDEDAHALIARLCLEVRLGEHGEYLGVDAVGDPHLVAVQEVVVAVADGLSLDRLEVGAGVGLRHAEGAPSLAGGHAGEEARFHLLAAVRLDHPGDHRVCVEDAAQAHPAAGQLLHDRGVGGEGEVQAAVLLRDRGAEHPQPLQLLDEVSGVFVRVLQLRGYRHDLFLHEAAHLRHDHLLLFGEGDQRGDGHRLLLRADSSRLRPS